MTTLHVLTMRANAALGRLATLQKKAERTDAASAPVLRAALKELANALEDLRVATDHLHPLHEEVESLRGRSGMLSARLEELAKILPVPCVWTTAGGEIESANPPAASLLNVSEAHLAGRPLMLFVADRQKFADALAAVSPDIEIDIPMTLRPRERRPRAVRLVGR